MSDIIIRAENLGKQYRLGRRERYKMLRDVLMTPFQSDRLQKSETIWALKDVSFEIANGEVVGLIGCNGAGKSTLLKILSRITEPTEGFADVYGRVGSLLEIGTGFHPELTGRENIFLNGAILGMRKTEINRKFDEIVAFAETEKFLDTPVKHYSNGMRVRLAFAVAAHLEPEILLVDEVLAVGDTSFQKKCLGKMGEVAKVGRTVLFVSHNMAAIQNLCQSAYLFDRGRICASGNVSAVVERYLATVAGNERTSLLDRKDRQGSGRLRLVETQVRGPGDSPLLQCGSAASFHLHYEASAPLPKVRIAMSIWTAAGEGAAFTDSEVIGKTLENLPPQGTLVCRFDKLPLLPGAYSFNLLCEVNGDLADLVVDATRFEVVEGDYFGSGRLPKPGCGAIAVPHDWTFTEGS